MDFWVVAAAAGAGYLAKYWKNVVHDKEGSSGFPSGRSLADNPEFPPLIQEICDKTSPINKLSRNTGEQYSTETGNGNYSDGTFKGASGRDDPVATNATCTSVLDRENQVERFEEYKDSFRLDAGVGDIPEYHTWEMGASHSPQRIKNSLRSRHLHLQYIKPRSSLDSCLVAQMHREHAEIKDYLLSPLCSPCTPALRPFLVTDGRQVISRASGDFRGGLCKEVHSKADNEVVGVPHLPQNIAAGCSKQKLNKDKNQMEKSSDTSKRMQFDTQDGSSSERVLFCLGISIGVMSTVIANKVELHKLNERLKQSENLVEDLQEELEMKDSLTVKELVIDDDSQDIHESLCGHEKMNLFSNQADSNLLIKYADEGSVSLEKVESMSKIEAELEAELERLELSMKGSTLQGRSSDDIEFDGEFDRDIIAELVHGELHANIIPRKSSSEPTPDRGSHSTPTPHSAKDGVSPRELTLRLHEVIRSRLELRVMELEAELSKTQKRVQQLESERMNSWREVSNSESSSTLGSPVARPLVMNLSGDALDAYNEAYEELNKLNESRTWLASAGEEALHDHRTTVRSNEGGLSDCDNKDDGDDDLLLIKQIVEKAKQGSPAVIRAQRAMVFLDTDEHLHW